MSEEKPVGKIEQLSEDDGLTGVVGVKHARRVLFSGAEEAAELAALREENARLSAELKAAQDKCRTDFELGTDAVAAVFRDRVKMLEQAAGGWVSVEERMPDEATEVEVVYRDVYGRTHRNYAWYAPENNAWYNRRDYPIDSVTHWRELPPMP